MKVAIIGAGVAGLATAALLTREGHEVDIIEQRGEVGGRAGSFASQGFRWDTGPSWYLMPDAFEHFFRLCGTSTEEQLELVDLSPAYRIIDEHGEVVDVRTGEAEDLFESREPGAGQRLHVYLDSASRIYQLAIDGFLYTTFSDFSPYFTLDMLRRIPQLLASLCTSLKVKVNTTFSDVKLRQILTYPAVFLSTHPESTPALYHLMSHTDLVQGVNYPLGGFAAVVRSLAALADASTVHLNTEVTGIRTEGSRVTGVDTDSGFIAADIVVSTADLHFTETRLLPEHLRTLPERRWARRQPGLGTVLILAGVRGELPELLHHTLLFSSDWDDDFRTVFDATSGASESIYISKTSATDPGVAPEGHENLFILVPVPAEVSLGHGDLHGRADGQVEAIAEAALAQIERWAGIPDLRERIVVSRTIGPADFADQYNAWSGGSIGYSHTLGQSAFLRGSNRSARVDGLYYAGATTVPGVGVPMCLISAENVVKRLRGDTTIGPLGTD
ncbi:phytoene desaturase family protein [Corynebacterium pacaense]|uniref:phytoene desaturase family protein n=1 Tax=Corynebacterium pacaense TaxID=1816684 RepID=UPI0009BA7CB1|nr:phytoene desaturase family protein [Corynebacterium pacaense]